MGLVLKLSWGELRRMPTREIRKNTLLELPSIGWQLFILDSSQSDSTAFPSCLDTYATRLLTEALSRTSDRLPCSVRRIEAQPDAASSHGTRSRTRGQASEGLGGLQNHQDGHVRTPFVRRTS